MFTEENTEGKEYKLSSCPLAAHVKIINCVGMNKKVLDVGCASGYLGKEFKNNGCYVVGIESDPERAAEAKNVLDDVLEADIDTLKTIPYNDGSFDVIVFADVLEHLKRPDRVLLDLKRYLKKTGKIIVSVPNVARIDIRIRLLLGDFTYASGGILDRTHLRFFTNQSIRKLLAGCGYSIEYSDFTGSLSQYKLLKPLAGLWAFQSILVAGIA